MVEDRYVGAKPTQVRVQEKPFGGLMPGEVVVIPSPHDVESALREIPSGRTRTQRQLRRSTAPHHNADNACPAMTGFQLRAVAELAVVELEAGLPVGELAPFWRVVEPDSKIAGRLPNGATLIRDLRLKESG